MMEAARNTLKFILLLILISITILSCDKNTEEKSIRIESPDDSVLIGNWLRTDSNYRIHISKVNEDFTLDAQYFNPQPINVGKAGWKKSNGDLKLTIELRDTNYPGSTYTLSYLTDRDMLAGEYYQAVQGLTFYVEFLRNR